MTTMPPGVPMPSRKKYDAPRVQYPLGVSLKTHLMLLIRPNVGDKVRGWRVLCNARARILCFKCLISRTVGRYKYPDRLGVRQSHTGSQCPRTAGAVLQGTQCPLRWRIRQGGATAGGVAITRAQPGRPIVVIRGPNALVMTTISPGVPMPSGNYPKTLSFLIIYYCTLIDIGDTDYRVNYEVATVYIWIWYEYQQRVTTIQYGILRRHSSPLYVHTLILGYTTPSLLRNSTNFDKYKYIIHRQLMLIFPK